MLSSPVVGDGLTALFWEDRWLHGQSIRELVPLLYLCIPKNRRRARTVAEGIADNAWARDIRGVVGLQEIGQYLRTWQLVARTILSTEPDKLVWKWTANGVYSARSCYRATFHGSLTCHSWQLIWKGWAPSKVKFFHWLANLDRGKARSPRPSSSHPLPAMRPRAGDHPTPAAHLPFCAASLARGPILAASTGPVAGARCLHPGLVDEGEGCHTTIAPQGVEVCRAAGALDDMEA
ncbi:Serine/threonine-protein kinase SMG1 [Hordeum vulgare]|uniref:uncharacterized protein LOC123426328 n=1 Tax=Hordeum vulgare subsp. vulgare TaxID=112509 RepID=UPI001D1A523E|nr:uncharacterized protein LOC123426328 [Hordeum vulgare subsp. vulgare]KAE8768431.1 Serine/threonine-protein kinase SMG1 [Hordeum vulgare]